MTHASIPRTCTSIALNPCSYFFTLTLLRMFGSVVGAFGRVSVRISVRQASFKLMMSAQHHNEWNRSELPVDMNFFGLFETGAITYIIQYSRNVMRHRHFPWLPTDSICPTAILVQCSSFIANAYFQHSCFWRYLSKRRIYESTTAIV